jgi:aspartyl protease family protein
MHRILLVALIVVAASAMAVRVIDQNGPVPAQATSEKSEMRQAGNRHMVVIKSEHGHFATEASVEGRQMAFMVDTGATDVALRESDAARLGYRPSPADYTIRVDTANGEARAARVELGKVEVGAVTVRDVKAMVVPDELLKVNLLGMSFLSRLRWTQDGGQLVLEQ